MADDVLFDITVIPRSSKQGIIIDQYDRIRINIKSPPLNGKANAELITLLSKRLSIAKSRIKIVTGEKNRKKRISAKGLKKEEVLKIIKETALELK